MTATLLQGILIVAAPLLLGALVLRAVGIRVRDDVVGWLGWLFPCGALALAGLVFAWMAVGLDVRGVPLRVLVVALPVVGLILLRRRSPEPAPGLEPLPWHKRQLVVAVVVMLVGGVTVAETIAHHATRPIAHDDDASIWSIRAKVFHDAGRFTDDIGDRLRAQDGAHHLDYPLLNPLLQVWVHACIGEKVDVEIRWPTWLWYVSLALMLYSACARRAGPALGALMSVAFVGAPLARLAGVGTKADLIVAVGLLGVLDMLLRARSAGAPPTGDPASSPRSAVSSRHLWLAGLFAAILVWGKNEGWMLALAVVLAGLTGHGLAVLRALPRRTTLAILVPVAVLTAHVAFNRSHGLENDLMTGGSGRDPRPLTRMFVENITEMTVAPGDREELPRWRHILAKFWTNMVDEPFADQLNYLWPAFFVLLFLFPRRALSAPLRFLTLTILAGWAGFFCVYVISFEEIHWHLHTSSARVTAQMLPAALLWIACTIRVTCTPRPG